MPSVEHLTGLSSEEARNRLASIGLNALPDKLPVSAAVQLARQFRNPLIYILLFALAVDLAAWWHEGARGWPFESLAIAAILFLNAMLGCVRGGSEAARHLRCFDHAACGYSATIWVQIETINWRPAILCAWKLEIESGRWRTGSGTSCRRRVYPHRRKSAHREGAGEELLGGPLVVRGRSFLEIVRTGPASALGRLAGMLEHVEEEVTPLERRLEAFGVRIASWVLLLCAVLMIEGLIAQGLGRWTEVLPP